MENKIEFIMELNKLLNMTYGFKELVIEVGYIDSGEFKASTERIEWLLFRWKDQNPKYGVLQSIECDSNYGILIDAMKAIRKM